MRVINEAPDDDPLQRKMENLKEQIRDLKEKQDKLRIQLTGREPAMATSPVPLPVWQQDAEEAETSRPLENRAFRRPLARQRNRDRALFFALALVLLGVIALVLWMYQHAIQQKSQTALVIPFNSLILKNDPELV